MKLPKDWQIKKLWDISNILYGKNLPTKDLKDSWYPVFWANWIIWFNDRYLYEDEMVLISCRWAASWKVNMSPKKCYITNNSLVLNLKEKSTEHKKYIFYFLHTINKSKIVTGSAQPQVTINNVVDMIIPLPPLQIQKIIVSDIEKQFSRLDYWLESLKQIKINIKNYRASILKAAVEWELTEEWRKAYIKSPEFENAEILLEKILKAKKEKNLWKNYKEFSKINKNNYKSVLPNGWVSSYFWNIADIESNLVEANNYLDFRFIAPDHIEKYSWKLLEKLYVKDLNIISPKHLYYENRIIYSKIRPNLSKLVISDSEWLCSADMYPIYSYIDLKYLFYYMLSRNFLKYSTTSWSRTVLPKINQNGLNLIPISVPPLAEQQKIVKEVESRLSIIEEMENLIDTNIKRANNLKQSILKKAFSWEII